MNRQSVRTRHLGDRDIWFERRMDYLAVAKCLFEDVIGFPECLIQIAAADTCAESDVSPGYALQIFEIRKGRGGSQGIVDNRSTGLRCRNLVEHGIQRFILHRDQIGRLFRYVWVGRERYRYRLTGIAHFLEREDRL